MNSSFRHLKIKVSFIAYIPLAPTPSLNLFLVFESSESSVFFSNPSIFGSHNIIEFILCFRYEPSNQLRSDSFHQRPKVSIF